MTTITATSTIGIVLASPSYANPIVINPGVTVYESGFAHGPAAVSAAAGSWTILNAGNIAGARLFGRGINLASGGDVTNQSSALISGAPGIYGGAGGPLGIVNYGSILGGIRLSAGGVVANRTGALILGSFGGQEAIYATNAAVTVVNAGTVDGGQGQFGIVLRAGGAVTNQSGGRVTASFGGAIGIDLEAVGTVVNQSGGTITAFGGAAAGVNLVAGGTITNQIGATVSATSYGIFCGPAGAATVVNAGTINGGVKFAPGQNDRLVVDPGAVFSGNVDGGNGLGAAAVSTLELASAASAGTISGFGALYRNFGDIALDNGARWNLGGTVAAGTTVAFAGRTGALTIVNPASMQGTISGFGGDDTIALSGITVTGSSYSNGVLTLTEAPGAVILDVAGNFATADFRVTNGAGGAAISLPAAGLLGSLNVSQQLELVYVAYFNRAADGGGFDFWGGQNLQARNAGQETAVALTNIANSFTPQPETIALYPFLGTPNLDLTSPAGQAGLTTFINSLYGNLFGHAPDTAGLNYWVGQLTSGTVGPGAAALAIANGATGTDAIELQNKITVALDFTTRTNMAGLGQTAPLQATFLAAARNVLSGVDGLSLNDQSVTAAMSATTAFISTGQIIFASPDPIALPMSGSALASATANDPITIATPNSVIDPGAGNHMIQFLTGSGGDTLVLHEGGLDQVLGFDPATDVLDLRSLLADGNVDPHGNIAALSNYLTIADQGADARVGFDPAGHGSGSMVAVLRGLGGIATELDTLIARGAIRTG
jgi:hypothetical protein